MADLPELMPNPAVTTGDHQLIAPGAATEGYQLGAAAAVESEQAIAATRGWAEERKNANAERALLAEMGTDPVLFPITSTVRPRIGGIVATYEQKLAALRASSGDLTREGLGRREKALAAERDAQLTAAEQDLMSQLDRTRENLVAKRDGLREVAVSPAHTHAAFDL